MTPHSLRHAFASVIVNLGEEPVYVMAQLGCTGRAFTLKIYSHIMQPPGGERARVKALINSVEWAPLGAKTDSADVEQLSGIGEEALEVSRSAG